MRRDPVVEAQSPDQVASVNLSRILNSGWNRVAGGGLLELEDCMVGCHSSGVENAPGGGPPMVPECSMVHDSWL